MRTSGSRATKMRRKEPLPRVLRKPSLAEAHVFKEHSDRPPHGSTPRPSGGGHALGKALRTRHEGPCPGSSRATYRVMHFASSSLARVPPEVPPLYARDRRALASGALRTSS